MQEIVERLKSYSKAAAILRQIHSDKALTYQKCALKITALTSTLTALLTFIGFMGNDRLFALFKPFYSNLDKGWLELGFNLLVLFVLIVSIWGLIFSFQNRAVEHDKSIKVLTHFIHDTDDVILPINQYSIEKQIELLRTTREQYKIITDFLPPSIDEDFLKAKKSYKEKKKKSHEYDLLINSASAPSISPNISLPTNNLKKTMESIIIGDPWMYEVLKTIDHVHNQKLWASAGFIRNKMWDLLHDYTIGTPLDDIDVIYFDPQNTFEEADQAIELILRELMPNIPWSVKNQARMHLRNGDQPYTSLEDALSKWPETATAIAVSLADGKEGLEFVAPYGFSDLLNLEVKPTEVFKGRMEKYRERIKQKNWKRVWPKLRIEGI